MDCWLQRRGENGKVGLKGSEREERREQRGEGGGTLAPLLSSSHPAAAHVRCELSAGRGQRSQKFIYRRMGLAAIWGVQSVSVSPAVPWRGKGAADTRDS